MSYEQYRSRLETSPFAVLATHGPGGRLDLVPCCFAFDDAAAEGPERVEIVTAVDHKPKSTTRLARLANIEADPAVSILVDHRDPGDWSQLWWVRAHGTGRVVVDGPAHRSAVAALVAKYPQYRASPPTGAVIRIVIDRWVGWLP